MRRHLIIALLPAIFCLPALAQATPATAISWSNVQNLAVGSKIRIKSDKKTTTCLIDSVREEQLSCSQSRAANAAHYEFPRAEIRTIKFSRKGHSALLGLALGAAIGAGAGAGIGAAINSSDKGDILHVSGGKSTGVGAALGVIIAAPVGALVAYSLDLFAGPLVYRR